VSTYFGTGLSKGHGKDHIIGTSSEYEVSQLVKWFLREAFRLHRFPEYILGTHMIHFILGMLQEETMELFLIPVTRWDSIIGFGIQVQVPI
jgi:hypothetical protein